MARNKKRDDTEVLQSIIAKSTNITAVATAQLELGALQERKAALAAAIQPTLEVPQIVAQPTSKKAVQKEEDVVKNIKKLREDTSVILGEAKKTSTTLESILKTNQKYFESNSEIINRLMMAANLSQEQVDALRKKVEAQGTSSETGLGTEEGNQPPSNQPGGGLLAGGILGSLATGIAGLIGSKLFKKKPKPDVDLDVDGKPKPKPDVDVDADGKPKPKPEGPEGKKSKFKGKGGRLAKILGLGAALYGGLELTKFLTDEDSSWRDLLPDDVSNMISDRAAQAIPDAALAVGLQAPTIVGALKSGGKPPPAPVAPPTARPATPPPAAEVPNAAPRAPAPGASAADDIVEAGAKASEKEIIEKASKIAGRSTLKSIFKKVPIISMLAGLGFGGYRYLIEGDTVGAGLEVSAGAAGMIPGVGTIGSIGIDVMSMMRDIYSAVYGTYPENDALASERYDELSSVVMKYLSDTYGTPAAETTSSDISMGAADDFGAAIAATTNAQTPVDTSSNPNMSRAQYLSSTPPAATPVQKMTPNKLNAIATPSGGPTGNIVINKQGDTITKVVNGNAGGGAPGIAGSPSKIPSPFDRMLYGETYNWGY